MNTHDAQAPAAASTLGSAGFRQDHGVRLAYMAGAMANGIASEALVLAMARAGLLASFGAAGLPATDVLAAVDRMRAALGGHTGFAVNIIHQVDDSEAEIALASGLLDHGVRTIEASAFMALSPAVVLFRARGLAGGAATRVIVKLSHPTVARAYLRPPPPDMLEGLVAAGHITRAQAEAAARVPVATDVTVEADSGGHTDRRPLTVLFPLIARLRHRLAADLPATAQVRLGAAGGLGTPEALAAAFAMGADYVVTGSINQATPEAGISDLAKDLLCQAGIEDMAMAPAADMFEIGAEVQVLKRGTMFAQRASRLGMLFKAHGGLADLSVKDRDWLETQVLRQSIAETVGQVAAYFRSRDPDLVARMAGDPKTEMALVFRWYLGRSSQWARDGQAARQPDMQLWCGPAMGAFNAFVAGSDLQEATGRNVARIADLLMSGAAMHVVRQADRGNGAPAPVLVSELGDSAFSDAAAPPPPTEQDAPKFGAAKPTEKLATSEVSAKSAITETPALSEDEIEDMILGEMAAGLGVSVDDIDPEEPFDSTDLDSAQAVVMMARLEAALGQKLSPTLVWNYPTPRKLAERLAGVSAEATRAAQRAGVT